MLGNWHVWQNPRRKGTIEKKTRSQLWSSKNHCFLWGEHQENLKYCFETCKYTTAVFPYDCGTIPHFLKKWIILESSTLTNLQGLFSLNKWRNTLVFQQDVAMFNGLVMIGYPWRSAINIFNTQFDANTLFAARWYHTNALPWCNPLQLKFEARRRRWQVGKKIQSKHCIRIPCII